MEHEVHGAFRAGQRKEKQPRRGGLILSPLNAIIDAEVAATAGYTVAALADAFIAGGARFIQVRGKAVSSASFLAMCQDVVSRGHRAGAVVIVNDRADIARLSGADGVHLGQDDLDPESARQIVGPGAVIGISTHSLSQVKAALPLSVDYVAVGPIFGTTTKDTGYREAGTALVREAASLLRESGDSRPLVAIGGITLERAPEVIAAGAQSIAVISDLLSSADPAARVRAFLQAVR